MTSDPSRPRCSVEALAREEPQFATASLVKAWLLIEQPGAWGPDALLDSGFPNEIARPLLRLAARVGARILLIRRRQRDQSDPVVFLAHSGGNGLAPTMVSGRISGPADLMDLDLDGLAEGRFPEFGRPVVGPVYLVCTHGRHDLCCADKGRPLYRAMSQLRPEQTWETSHIGGDRFAGNLVVLPRGDYFGRLDPEDTDNLVAAYEERRLDLTHYRGRSVQPRLVQAAEHYLRARRALSGFDELEVVDYRRPEPHHGEVVFRDSSLRTHRVRVMARTLPDPVFLTCRAGEPGQPVAYDLLSMEEG
ncbi:MAG TPA: sucrase ferredoxin [Acidimicrobiia bacterium]